MAIKTMKISELIGTLQAYKKELGDIAVFHQADPEGNGYGTIENYSLSWDNTKLGKALFICPTDEYIESELF